MTKRVHLRLKVCLMFWAARVQGGYIDILYSAEQLPWAENTEALPTYAI
jgi:hypothetical protein